MLDPAYCRRVLGNNLSDEEIVRIEAGLRAFADFGLSVYADFCMTQPPSGLVYAKDLQVHTSTTQRTPKRTP